MDRSEGSRSVLSRSLRLLRGVLLTSTAGLIVQLSLGCSLLLPGEAAQCHKDSDCDALGFEGAFCDAGAGICVESRIGVGGSDSSAGGGAFSFFSGGSGGEGGNPTSGGGGSEMMQTGGTDQGGGPTIAPPAIRAIGAPKTPIYGGTGSAPYADICPLDQVLVGLNVWTNPNSSFIQRTQAVCGEMDLDGTTVSILEGEELRVRGLGLMDGMDVMESLTCGSNEVVVGFNGRAGIYLDELQILCAPLSGFADGDGVRLVVGKSVTGDAVIANSDGGDVFSAECGTGEVVRGPVVRSGQWIDGFGVTCTTPTIAYSEGLPCESGDECKSGACDGSCQPMECEAPVGCECALINDKTFVLCPKNNLFDAAQDTCESVGRSLVRIDSDQENGWLRNTADSFGMGDFFIGASDQAVEGEWRWMDGEQFWAGASDGTSVGNLYSLWHPTEPNDSGNCAYNAAHASYGGSWLDTLCSLSQNFVCQ